MNEINYNQNWVEYEGHDYIFTGKIGTGVKDGLHAKEYSFTDRYGEHRVWVNVSNEITPD